MNSDISRLERDKRTLTLGLSPSVAATPLLHGLRQVRDSWLTHPERYASREDIQTDIELVSGVDASWCVLNANQPFQPDDYHSDDHHEHIEHIDIRTQSALPGNAPEAPVPASCTSLNRSKGGVAVRYHHGQQAPPRVGQLVSLSRPGSSTERNWVIAACRWLASADGKGKVDMGLQYLALDPRPALLHTTGKETGSAAYSPVITACQKRGGEPVHTLIAGSGVIEPGDRLMLVQDDRKQAIMCGEELEAGPGFARYTYRYLNAG